MKHSLYITVLLLVLENIHAQVPDSTNVHEKASINKTFLKSYVSDIGDVFTFSKHFSKKNWIVTGAFIGSASILMTQDEKIQRFVQEHRDPSLDKFTKHGLEPFGNLYSFGTMGIFYLHGQVFKNERSKKVALLCVKSYLISGLMVTIPKFLLGRHRPNADIPPNAYMWEGPSLDHRSFPSGHTTSVFSIATIIAMEYKENIAIPVISYSIATLAGISRIYENKHWASDVVIGAGIGTLVGYIIHKQNNWGIEIKPARNQSLNGIAIILPITGKNLKN